MSETIKERLAVLETRSAGIVLELKSIKRILWVLSASILTQVGVQVPIW